MRAKRTIKKLFENNIQNNSQINWVQVKNKLGVKKALRIQAGIESPDEDYLDLQNVFMSSLSDDEKSEFIKNILNQSFTPKQLLRIDNAFTTNMYSINFVLGLFKIPSESKNQFSKFLSDYFELYEKDILKKERQQNTKTLITNFGVCPKCMSKISKIARKCPYCTADLD
jgi:hypothetical protein